MWNHFWLSYIATIEYIVIFNTGQCTQIHRSGCKHSSRCTYWYTACTHTHIQYTHTHRRGRGDLIKCRQWLCGLCVQWSWAPSCHSNSSSRPIRCCIKAGAAIKRWVHRRHCCVRGQQSATSPAGICRRRSRRESHLTTASAAEARLPAVWSSPDVCVCDRNRRPLGWK